LADYAPGWHEGHRGIDRPGFDFETTESCGESARCCFDRCASTSKCEAWTLSANQCKLKSAIPTQVKSSLNVTSGVKRASAGLRSLLFKNYQLGTTEPTGWLRTQLVLTANGQAGHLELFWDDVMDSVWIGGAHDHSGAGHERGPYWLNGVVALAAHLNASGDTAKSSLVVDLQGQADRWVYYILDHQTVDGWLGPDDGFGGPGNTYWTGWNVAASLLQYADAHKNSTIGTRCEAAVLKYVECTHTRMLATPTTTWSQNRWQDWVYIVHWLLDQAPQGQEQLLWDAAELTQQQSWDWDAYYDQLGVGTTGAYKGKVMPKFPPMNVGHWSMYDHGVNNAMATKSSATWYRQSGNESDAAHARQKLTVQDRFHGQPHGMFSADECFGGRELNRGIELCAVVEQMYSLQHNFKVLGDVSFLDRLERIAFNSLPGTLDPTQWQHQYLQQANEINARYGIAKHVWQTDGDDSTGFGVAPNFGCCTANFVQGWAKFASNILMQSHEDGGVVVAVLAPVRAVLEGVTVEVVTDYPFGDDLQVHVDVTSSSAVPVHIRIPGWATGATVAIGTQKAAQATNGTFHKVLCAPGSTTISVELNPVIRVEREWGVQARQGPTPVAYSASGASVSTVNASNDFVLVGGAALANSKTAGLQDIRSGAPHTVSSATVSHSIYGEGHMISSVSFSFRYLCGYNCHPTSAVGAPTVSLDVLDAANNSVIDTIYTSGPLNNYSYDRGDPYSPAVVVQIGKLSIPNSRPVLLSVRFNNNMKNLQLNLNAQTGFDMQVQWSSAKAPGPAPLPPQSNLIPGTAAAAVLRGPLLYTLLVGQKETLVRTWLPFNNTDVNLDNSTQWNYALLLDDAHPMKFMPAAAGLNREIPFNTSNYFAVIQATAKQLPGWHEESNAAAEPPASPVDCSVLAGGCGEETQVTLVPYGSTNLRMSGLPWIG